MPQDVTLIAIPVLVAVPESHCLACGAAGQYASTGSEVRPAEGDLVICLGCGEWQIFTADLMVRPFVRADLDEFEPEDLARFCLAVRELRAAFAQRN